MIEWLEAGQTVYFSLNFIILLAFSVFFSQFHTFAGIFGFTGDNVPNNNILEDII